MLLKKKVIIVLTISGLILMIFGLLLSDSHLKTDNVIVLLLSLLLSLVVFSIGLFCWFLVASSLSDTAWGKIDEAIEKKEKEIQAQKNGEKIREGLEEIKEDIRKGTYRGN